MKVWVVSIDWDGTMRSSPWPVAVFSSKEAAETYTINKVGKERFEEKEVFMRMWEIEEFEVDKK